MPPSKILITFCAIMSAAAFAIEVSEEELLEKTTDQYRSFWQDSAAFMDAVPLKLGSQKKSQFSKDDIESKLFVIKKDQARANKKVRYQNHSQRIMEVTQGRSGPDDFNSPERFLQDPRYIRNVFEMHTNLRSGKVKVAPWSDDYWATYAGGIAKRYADTNFPNSEGWKRNFDFSLKAFNEAFNAAASGSLENDAMKKLSPAEKYDLLTGAKSFQGSLTESSWNQGKYYWVETKKVEPWMGLCDGWAQASIMVDRPKHMVNAIAADGKTEVSFYPADIKALNTLLWANGGPASLFMGGRCDDTKPAKERSGRVKSDECFDTNPMSWHAAVVNMVGKNKKSFIIDATYDYEVWNQPVHSYKYVYFNPVTGESTTRLKDAIVNIEDYATDKFKNYRSEKTKMVVGISMDLTYVVEVEPSHFSTDSTAYDATNTVNYMYDLELDSQGNMVGGEWYTNLHPDFVWAPPEGSKAESFLDSKISAQWNVRGEKIPAQFQQAAEKISENHIPLARIVEALVVAAQSKN